MLSNRAIYRSRYIHYIGLICLSKSCRSFGIFLSYDILKLVHVVQFLFFVKAGASVLLVLLQKPFSSGKRISKHEWFRVVRHALLGTGINLLWLFGLTLCGPMRTLLLFEHSDLVIITAASALFTSSSSPAKLRGAVFFILAVLGILLLDHDDLRPHHAHGQENHELHRESHNGIVAHLFDHMTNLTGLSDHKGGVVLLFFTLSMHVGFKSAAKKLSVDIGGAKRLHALSSLVSAGLLLPWSMAIYFTQESQVISWTSVMLPLLLVVVFVFVADYYIEGACINRLELSQTSRFSAITIFMSALLLSCFWNHPFVSQMTTMHLKEIIAEDHVLSGGVIFSIILFIFATHILTSHGGVGSKGSFVGYSAAGLPLYNFTGENISKTSHSILLFAKNGLTSILENTDSRKIFFFLCINLFFTFVELVYGVWTNSLGLISDGFHMLFDCSALVMGLYAAVMSRWKATRIYSYGFDRVEVLSGFINGLFLLVIAFFVFTAAITRLLDPPKIKTEQLLTVSVIGLLVNLIGIFAFSHGHSHGGGNIHSHGDGNAGNSHSTHGHSHAGQSHSQSSPKKSHGHSHGLSVGGSTAGHSHNIHNTNMQGVFLHVLADTMGSVGVIISTLLIENLGWNIADPICSVFISVLIFVSVLPLVKETALILLLQCPEDAKDDITQACRKISTIDGVVGYRNEHFWRHSSKCLAATIHVQIQPTVSEQVVIIQVILILKEAGINNLTVQLEKEDYFNHMAGLEMRIGDVYHVTQDSHTFNYQTTSTYLKGL